MWTSVFLLTILPAEPRWNVYHFLCILTFFFGILLFSVALEKLQQLRNSVVPRGKGMAK